MWSREERGRLLSGIHPLTPRRTPESCPLKSLQIRWRHRWDFIFISAALQLPAPCKLNYHCRIYKYRYILFFRRSLPVALWILREKMKPQNWIFSCTSTFLSLGPCNGQIDGYFSVCVAYRWPPLRGPWGSQPRRRRRRRRRRSSPMKQVPVGALHRSTSTRYRYCLTAIGTK